MPQLHEVTSYILWAWMDMFSILLALWTSVFKIEEGLNSISMYKVAIWKQKTVLNFYESESVVSGAKRQIFINQGVFWDENKNPPNNTKEDPTPFIAVELEVFSETAVLFTCSLSPCCSPGAGHWDKLFLSKHYKKC